MLPYNLNPFGFDYIIDQEAPLTFTAQQANSTVKLTATGSPTVSGLYYRYGKSGAWLPYTIDQTITLANIGDSVQFWNSAQKLSTSTTAYVQFDMSGTVKGSGNLMSLLNYSESCKSYCFLNLFRDCISLITPPKMPALTMSNYCYYQTYYGSGLVSPPEFPALTLVANCYYGALRACTSLTSAPQLPATTLANYCYNSMLRDCSGIKSIVLPAQTLVPYCYRMMLQDSGVTSITVNFSNWNVNNATNNWVSGVGASGTFNKPSALAEQYGANRIPSGWTVNNK